MPYPLIPVNLELNEYDRCHNYIRVINRKEIIIKSLYFRLTSAALLLLFLSACGGGLLRDPLNSTAWILIAINDTPALVNTSVTVEFADGKIGGSSGCNSYGGAYTVSGKKITTDSIAMTLMACLDPVVMEQERVFLEHLQNAQTFKLTEDKLQVFSSDGKSLTFIQNPHIIF